MEEEHTTSKRTWYLVGGIVVLLIIGGLLIFSLMGRNEAGSAPLISWPFGKTTNTPDGNTPQQGNLPNSPDGGDTNSPSATIPKLRQLSDIPAAGAMYFKNPSGTRSVRFVAKETGNIYDVDISSLKTTRVTNTAIPRIAEATFVQEGNGVILRYLAEPETIKTLYAKIIPGTAGDPGHLETSFLPDNITSISVSPTGKEVFFLMRSAVGVTGFNYTPLNDAPKYENCPSVACKQVFEFPFAEWLPQNIGNNTVLLTTKAANSYPGYLYELNTKTGTLTRRFGNKNTLTTNSFRTGKKILFSELEGRTTVLSVYDASLKSESPDQSIVLPMRTLPEKCTWSKGGNLVYCGAPTDTYTGTLPDDWYQGITPSVDSLSVYNISKAESALLSDPFVDVHTLIDVAKPFLSTDTEDMLFFLNNIDNTPWALSLTQTSAPTTDTGTILESEQSDVIGSKPATTKKPKK